MRSLYEYKLVHEDEPGQQAITTNTEEEADTLIKDRIADLEFVEVEEIEWVKLLDRIEPKGDTYYECDGCT